MFDCFCFPLSYFSVSCALKSVLSEMCLHETEPQSLYKGDWQSPPPLVSIGQTGCGFVSGRTLWRQHCSEMWEDKRSAQDKSRKWSKLWPRVISGSPTPYSRHNTTRVPPSSLDPDLKSQHPAWNRPHRKVEERSEEVLHNRHCRGAPQTEAPPLSVTWRSLSAAQRHKAALLQRKSAAFASMELNRFMFF